MKESFRVITSGILPWILKHSRALERVLNRMKNICRWSHQNVQSNWASDQHFLDSHLFFAKFWILVFTIHHLERLIWWRIPKERRLEVKYRGFSAHACCMSKILLLFYRNFGLDQERGQIANEKYQRREPWVVQNRFFSRTCQRGRNVSWSVAFQASESMLHILTIRSFQEFMAIGLHANKRKIVRCLVLIRVFSVEYSFP